MLHQSRVSPAYITKWVTQQLWDGRTDYGTPADIVTLVRLLKTLRSYYKMQQSCGNFTTTDQVFQDIDRLVTMFDLAVAPEIVSVEHFDAETLEGLDLQTGDIIYLGGKGKAGHYLTRNGGRG